MKYDDILVYLGGFGKYQKWVYFLLCVPSITLAFHALGSVFITPLPDHRCAIPGLTNDTYKVQSEAHRWLINQSIPRDEDEKYERCELWVTDSTGNRSISSCHRWVFDKSVFHTTATEQMSLVCDNLIRRSHLNMLFQGGIMFGSFTLGPTSDLFGRKKVMYISLIVSLIVGIANVWVPEFISLCFARFLLGTFGFGYFLSAFTIGMETVSPSKRMWTGMIIAQFWVLGEAILVLMAYFIREWQYLQLAISVPSVLYISYWWLIPESPRWLITNGRRAEAEKVIRHTAKVNKVILPDKVFENTSNEDDVVENVRLWKMFVHPTLLIRSLIIFFNWCVVSMVYYGLSLNSGYLYGGVHLNFFLSAVFEFIGYGLCFPLLDRIGRKPLHAACMIVGGVACCCTIFSVLYLAEEYQAVTTALSLVGKLGASAAFSVIYIFSNELFPTVVRNSGMGLSSVSARVGSMASPYIADLGVLAGGTFGIALPLMIFGILSVLAGIASLFLPETLGRQLPETIEDAINFKHQKREGEKDKINMGKEKVVGVSVQKLDYDNPALDADDIM